MPHLVHSPVAPRLPLPLPQPQQQQQSQPSSQPLPRSFVAPLDDQPLQSLESMHHSRTAAPAPQADIRPLSNTAAADHQRALHQQIDNEWNQQTQSAVEEMTRERDLLKQKCDDMQQIAIQLQAQLQQQKIFGEQQKILYENATADKQLLRDQFEQRLAETKAESQQIYDSYKCLLLSQSSLTGAADQQDAIDLLETQLAQAKLERDFYASERHAFASEVDALLTRLNAQEALAGETANRLAVKESLCDRLEYKLSQAYTQITQLQGQVQMMVHQRDDGEVRAMRAQVAEMKALLLVAQQQQTKEANEARQQRMDALVQSNSTTSTTASAALAASRSSTTTVAATLTAATEKASKKRKEREQALEQAETNTTAATTPAAPATETILEEHAPTKAKKQLKASAAEIQKAEKMTVDAAPTPAPATAALAVVDDEEVEAPKKKATSKRAKKQPRETEAIADKENANAAAARLTEAAAIAAKWNIKLGSSTTASTTGVSKSASSATVAPPAQPQAMPAKSSLARSHSALANLVLSPIARAEEDTATITAAPKRTSSSLSDLEAELDASACELNTSLNESSSSTDSTVSDRSTNGDRRRKLFPTKRTDKTAKVAWADPATSEPVVVQFEREKALTAAAAAAASATAAPTAATAASSRAPFHTLQSTAASRAAPHTLAYQPQKPVTLAPAAAAPRPLVGLPAAPPPGATRNLFMHFLGGAMKVPKIKAAH